MIKNAGVLTSILTTGPNTHPHTAFTSHVYSSSSWLWWFPDSSFVDLDSFEEYWSVLVDCCWVFLDWHLPVVFLEIKLRLWIVEEDHRHEVHFHPIISVYISCTWITTVDISCSWDSVSEVSILHNYSLYQPIFYSLEGNYCTVSTWGVEKCVSHPWRCSNTYFCAHSVFPIYLCSHCYSKPPPCICVPLGIPLVRGHCD